MNKSEKLSKMMGEMSRLKAYFPYRIIHGVYCVNTNEYSVYTRKTRRTLNKDLKNKDVEVYQLGA